MFTKCQEKKLETEGCFYFVSCLFQPTPFILKTGILKCPGPVVSTRCVQQVGIKSCRHITQEEFIKTVSSLTDFGKLVTVKLNFHTKQCHVFVKHDPNKIPRNKFAVVGFPEATYRKRYNCPIPLKTLGTKVFQQLLEMGYVTEVQAKTIKK